MSTLKDLLIKVLTYSCAAAFSVPWLVSVSSLFSCDGAFGFASISAASFLVPP